MIKLLLLAIRCGARERDSVEHNGTSKIIHFGCGFFAPPKSRHREEQNEPFRMAKLNLLFPCAAKPIVGRVRSKHVISGFVGEGVNIRYFEFNNGYSSILQQRAAVCLQYAHFGHGLSAKLKCVYGAQRACVNHQKFSCNRASVEAPIKRWRAPLGQLNVPLIFPWPFFGHSETLNLRPKMMKYAARFVSLNIGRFISRCELQQHAGCKNA